MEESGLTMNLDEEALKKWKKNDLVEWLVNRKKKKSGNKAVLIHRIIRSLQFDNSDDESDSDTDQETSESNEILPPVHTLKDGWDSLSTNTCPPTRGEDVENYFIYNKNPLTGKSKACHRQLKKAKKFCKERYVHDIETNSLRDSDYCYIRAKCKPSMKDIVVVSDGRLSKHYNLHVVIVKRTGKIESGSCDCKPGVTGLCSHIGGLLLTICEVKNACTSQPCEWLKPQTVKRLQPERLRDIVFSNPSTSQERDIPIKPYPDTYQAGPCKDPDVFLTDIMNGLGNVNPTCVLYRTLNPNIIDLSDISSKYEPSFMYSDTVNLNSTVCQSEFRNFTNGICLTEAEIEAVQESTRGQNSNPKWKEMRKNIITASNFGSVCKKRPETEPDNLLCRLRSYKQPFDTKAMRYGRKKESQARREYASYHLRKCGHVTIDTTGLVISKEFPFLGASVDGIINCKECGVGALEMKCPFSGRNLKPTECVNLKSFCCKLDENDHLELINTHNYMYQVMGQMKVLGLDYCDFVIWTKKGIHVQRIMYDENFWQENMLFKLKFFYNSFFVAELFTNRVRRGRPLL